MSRLIDADALWEKMYKYSDNEGAKMPYGDDDSLIHRDSACFLIEEAPTINPEPHWIPVEQALPELRHDVLLTVFFHERWNVAEGYRQDGEFMFWNNGILESVLDEENRVIAWMPKPEPFKGVTE